MSEQPFSLTPQQIRTLRVRWGMSQRAFGQLLGWGPVTVHRFESGKTVPQGVYDDLLWLLTNDVVMGRYMAAYFHRLTPRRQALVVAAVQRHGLPFKAPPPAPGMAR